MTTFVGAPELVEKSIAQYLHNLGLAVYADAYPTSPTKPTVWFGILPSKPDLAVAINHYNRDPDPDTTEGNPLVMVQLLWRAPGSQKHPVERLAHAAFEVLHNPRTPVNLPGGLRALSVVRQSSAPPAQDSNVRWTKAENYYIRLTPGE
jgi:hypothetical protein